MNYTILYHTNPPKNNILDIEHGFLPNFIDSDVTFLCISLVADSACGLAVSSCSKTCCAPLATAAFGSVSTVFLVTVRKDG